MSEKKKGKGKGSGGSSGTNPVKSPSLRRLRVPVENAEPEVSALLAVDALEVPEQTLGPVATPVLIGEKKKKKKKPVPPVTDFGNFDLSKCNGHSHIAVS